MTPGTYTATLIIQIPGKDGAGNACIFDYTIKRNFEVTPGAVSPQINPIPHHFDVENAIPTGVSNVPANATDVECFLDNTALAVNWSAGSSTATASLGNTSQ